jgi:hypothetical protein
MISKVRAADGDGDGRRRHQGDTGRAEWIGERIGECQARLIVTMPLVDALYEVWPSKTNL